MARGTVHPTRHGIPMRLGTRRARWTAALVAGGMGGTLRELVFNLMQQHSFLKSDTELLIDPRDAAER